MVVGELDKQHLELLQVVEALQTPTRISLNCLSSDRVLGPHAHGWGRGRMPPIAEDLALPGDPARLFEVQPSLPGLVCGEALPSECLSLGKTSCFFSHQEVNANHTKARNPGTVGAQQV